MFSFISLIVRISFIIIKHPLAIGIILVIQTLVISIIIGLISKTFWFSYILFLTFLGGILILFIYITSLASNELFFFSIKYFFIITRITIIIALIIFIFDKNFIYFYLENIEIKSINNIFIYINENVLILRKLYNFPINLITIILINYLFLTLIISVKITNLYKGPLRSNLN